MKNPKITVITPSYNQGSFIEETILSVLNQTYKNVEYIIIDGGSKDNTVDIIKKYSDKIDYWVSEKDSGQTNALNKGVKVATGEILCWINSDDVLVPWALQKVADFFSNHPDIAIVNGYTLRIDKYSKCMYNHFVPEPTTWFSKHGIYYINQPSMFFKRKLIDELGVFEESFHARMDQEFVMRVLAAGNKFGKINKVLGTIRIHEDTKTSQNGAMWSEDLQKLENKYKSHFKVKPDLVGSISYVIYKIVSLDYLKQFLFTKKWKGVSLKDFNAQYNYQ